MFSYKDIIITCKTQLCMCLYILRMCFCSDAVSEHKQKKQWETGWTDQHRGTGTGTAADFCCHGDSD